MFNPIPANAESNRNTENPHIMRKSRCFFFALTILIGILAGLVLAWMITPPRPRTNAVLSDLRADYKTDLVLMIAENFALEQDKLAALERLSTVDGSDPLTLLVNSIRYGEGIGLPVEDIGRIRHLFNALDMPTIEAWREGRNGK